MKIPSIIFREVIITKITLNDPESSFRRFRVNCEDKFLPEINNKFQSNVRSVSFFDIGETTQIININFKDKVSNIILSPHWRSKILSLFFIFSILFFEKWIICQSSRLENLSSNSILFILFISGIILIYFWLIVEEVYYENFVRKKFLLTNGKIVGGINFSDSESSTIFYPEIEFNTEDFKKISTFSFFRLYKTTFKEMLNSRVKIWYNPKAPEIIRVKDEYKKHLMGFSFAILIFLFILFMHLLIP